MLREPGILVIVYKAHLIRANRGPKRGVPRRTQEGCLENGSKGTDEAEWHRPKPVLPTGAEWPQRGELRASERPHEGERP